jgi:hypothetical protein
MKGSTKAPPLITTRSPRKTGADEGNLLRRAMIEPVDDVHADDDRNDGDDQPEDQLTNQIP